MHPGGDSLPGDPNAAFYLDGTYHLHYILAHPWKEKKSFSFVHVTSPDMLHWTWQPTKLQPSFTGHGMFSGTGFITKEGKPAAIYHGQGSGKNQIAIATDRQAHAHGKSLIPSTCAMPMAQEAKIRHWDPDCFLIGDTYYAISGGEKPPLLKSKDLKTWTPVGDFLRHDMPDVAHGEDISCANFFPLGNKWMLLCISHPLGCRYYLGDWDAQGRAVRPADPWPHELAQGRAEPLWPSAMARGFLCARKPAHTRWPPRHVGLACDSRQVRWHDGWQNHPVLTA